MTQGRLELPKMASRNRLCTRAKSEAQNPSKGLFAEESSSQGVALMGLGQYTNGG
jgi:hypothetical protein